MEQPALGTDPRLGTTAIVSKVELDTNHFKGNYPESASLEGCAVPSSSLHHSERDHCVQCGLGPLRVPAGVGAATGLTKIPSEDGRTNDGASCLTAAERPATAVPPEQTDICRDGSFGFY
jgi:hypothetical protein